MANHDDSLAEILDVQIQRFRELIALGSDINMVLPYQHNMSKNIVPRAAREGMQATDICTISYSALQMAVFLNLDCVVSEMVQRHHPIFPPNMQVLTSLGANSLQHLLVSGYFYGDALDPDHLVKFLKCARNMSTVPGDAFNMKNDSSPRYPLEGGNTIMHILATFADVPIRPDALCENNDTAYVLHTAFLYLVKSGRGDLTVRNNAGLSVENMIHLNNLNFNRYVEFRNALDLHQNTMPLDLLDSIFQESVGEVAFAKTMRAYTRLCAVQLYSSLYETFFPGNGPYTGDYTATDLLRDEALRRDFWRTSSLSGVVLSLDLLEKILQARFPPHVYSRLLALDEYREKQFYIEKYLELYEPIFPNVPFDKMYTRFDLQKDDDRRRAFLDSALYSEDASNPIPEEIREILAAMSMSSHVYDRLLKLDEFRATPYLHDQTPTTDKVAIAHAMGSSHQIRRPVSNHGIDAYNSMNVPPERPGT